MKNEPSLVTHIRLSAEVPPELAGKRLDFVLAKLFPEHSRSRLKEWVEQGLVRVDGSIKRPKDKVKALEALNIEAEIQPAIDSQPEDLPLNIAYEDDFILVLNKQANLVVHPAAGNPNGTLVNALLNYSTQLINLPRAGIVHRLDKDTTGLMVIAKTLEAQTKLVALLQARKVTRIYEAVVQGLMTGGGTVDAPIGRHPKERKRMAVVEDGKPAITHYRIIKKFQSYTHLRIQLETGRTHQIRVHMAQIRHPLVGDRVYGGRLRLPPNVDESLREYIRLFPRQALHATSLGLVHPITGEDMTWNVPLPEDIQALLQKLSVAEV